MPSFTIHFEGAHAFFLLNDFRPDVGMLPGIVVHTPYVEGHAYTAFEVSPSGKCRSITESLAGDFGFVVGNSGIIDPAYPLEFKDDRNVALKHPTFTPKPRDGSVQATFWLPLPQKIESSNCTCPTNASSTQDLFTGTHKGLVKARHFATLQSFIYQCDSFPPGFEGLWRPMADGAGLVISASLANPPGVMLHDHQKDAMDKCTARMNRVDLNLVRGLTFDACPHGCAKVQLCSSEEAVELELFHLPPRSCAGATATID